MVLKDLNNLFKGDKVIWMLFFILAIISTVEVYSASSQLTYKGGFYWMPMAKHVSILLLGFFFILVIQNIECRYFKLFTPFFLFFSIISLIAVMFMGSSTNDSQRWLNFIGIQFQPSEIAKGTLVLATAQILSAMQTDNGADRKAFKFILCLTTPIVIFIMVENLSTAALLCAVIFLMMLIGRVPLFQLGKLMGFIFGILALIVIMIAASPEEKPMTENQQLTEVVAKPKEKNITDKVFHRFSTWKSRIKKFANKKEIPPEEVDLDKDAQISHARIAIASSNFIGKGPGNSVERDFLSQAFSDFIYAIIIEEMGIIGAILVAFLFVVLLFRCGRIANRCQNPFPAFLIMGLALLLSIQAMFNMAVAVGLAPVTGQPLPLISKGGTSTLINCVYIGVILSISKSAKKREKEVKEEDELAATTE